MSEILLCLTKHGECLDSEIADETGISLSIVREGLARLAAAGEIITCALTRFESGVKTEALVCRVAGYVPQRAPGRKPNPTT